ncbi:cystatin-like protein [Drosophila montana]|uniref:cystatin-like protein n=1 Tax=Drosophila montana TaxID=40370 RepID=UPI00313A7DA2
MNCEQFLYLMSALALASGAEATDSEMYPIMGLHEQLGELRTYAIQFLDEQLDKLANISAGAVSYKALNLISVRSQGVAAKKLTYETELTTGFETKKCNVRIWHQFWLVDNTDIKISCQAIKADDNTPLEGMDEEMEYMLREEAIELLKESLSIMSQEHAASYNLAKVISVKKQYVSGAVTIFVGQLTDGKTNKQCAVTTWEGYPSNIKIKCEGDDAELNFTL